MELYPEKQKRSVNEMFLKEAKKELAFTSKGIDYYQFTEGGVPIYQLRFIEMQERINLAREMAVTKDTLYEFLEMMQVYTGRRGGDSRIQELSEGQRLAEINGLVGNMLRRLEIQNDLGVIYDIATVWYFDETEDPAYYDAEYGRIKKQRWLEDDSLRDFFLQTPLTNFVDFKTDSQDYTQSYLEAIYHWQFTQSVNNLSMLSQKERESETGMLMLSQALTFQALGNLASLE